MSANDLLTPNADYKKGTVCHKMIDCGHVFCVECLQDFYNNAIKEGDLASVRCLAPNCAKEREQAAASSSGSTNKKQKKRKTYLSPSELLQIPLDQETVKRYVTLKYKTELESDKNTIYCPRQWCNGAARSKKHKKPQGLELNDDNDDDDEDEEEETTSGGGLKPYNATDLLAICEDCNFAFCSRCHQSWHGEFVRCQPPRKNDELTEEEIASLEYMKLHTTPCPTCAAPAQKTHGCNHMICYRCQTHFCYLCSAWLDPGNPYQHFNEMPGGRITGCYQRLWELEQGDGDDVGLGFEGGNGAAPAAAAGRANNPGAVAAAGAPALPAGLEDLPEDQLMAILAAEMEMDSDDEEDLPLGNRGPNGQPQAEAQNQNGAGRGAGGVAVAREGPLVLRIDGGNQPAAGRGGRGGGGGAAAAAAAAPNGPAAGGARGGRGGGGRGDNARGGQGQGGANNVRAQHQNRGGAPNNRHNNRNGGGGGVGAGAAGARMGQPQLRGGGGGGGGAGAGGVPVPVRGNVGGRARRGPNDPRMDFDNPNNPDNIQVNVPDGIRLDPQQEAWIRQFVHLALEDQEDLLFDDDDW